MGTGAYVVLPLMGPSTVRDIFALPVDFRGNVVRYVDPVSARNTLYGLRLVEVRSNLLRAGSVLDSAALDKYSFTRDVYLQVRDPAGNSPFGGGTDDQDANDGRLPAEPPQ